jgi:hypothetical protein
MSTFNMLWQAMRHWINAQAFFIVNKIQKPKEVLVIVARTPPRRMRMNKSSRLY